MKNRTGVIVVALASAVAGVWAAAPVETGTAERSILVTVLDQAGAPVKDMVAADFSVYEGGAKREVLSAGLATEPMFVSVLIDNAKSPMGTAEPIRDMRTSLTTFVRTVLTANPTAQISLTTVGGAGVMLKDFSDKPADLEKTLNRLVPDLRSTAVVMEAMIDAARALGKKTGPRRVLVTIDRGSKESSQVVPTKVVEEVRKSGAAVWSISVQDSQGMTSPQRDTTLNYLTENTGGVRATALMPSALEMLLKNLAEALTTQYVVTYAGPDGPASQSVLAGGKKGTTFLIAPWRQ